MRFLYCINSKVIFCTLLFVFSQNSFSQKKGNKNKILSFSESIYESLNIDLLVLLEVVDQLQ